MDQEEQEEGEGTGEETSGGAGEHGQDVPGRIHRTCVLDHSSRSIDSDPFHLCTGDLVGLKVSHDFDGLDEGEARILTLKDSRILDNEGTRYLVPIASSLIHHFTEDELQNVEMAEEERHQKNKELKIKKRDYTGYDDEEFADGNLGMKRSVLAKYDEEIEGTRETVGVLYRSKISFLTSSCRASAWEITLRLLRQQWPSNNSKQLPWSTSLCCRLTMPVRNPSVWMVS